MKRALLVGIDTYDRFGRLSGCVNDVHALNPLLSYNEDDSPNFDCHALTSTTLRVERGCLLRSVHDLLAPGADVALFYFAGHGTPSHNDVILVTQDGTNTDPGVPLSEVLGKIQDSLVGEVIIILDCCFAGGAGRVPQLGSTVSVIRSGVTILASSRSDQPAAETAGGRGRFSWFLCGALDGGAADVLGKITLAGVYSYLSESFGPWDQRPTLKANVDRLHQLRMCAPVVPLHELRLLSQFFPHSDHEFALDPSYEPEAKPANQEHEAVFKILQKCVAAKLVRPVGAGHMYFAAIESRGCVLTPLGKLYRRLASQGRL
ncbi:MAG: caspase family protein [Gammaproteobacteria bacterium]|nr:caspase family protein [Gammaproteobacteria bacterium]